MAEAMAINQSNTPRVPKVGLTTFATYLTASASERIDCVREQIRMYEQSYVPGPAFYRDFVEAVRRARVSGADELILQRLVASQPDGPRKQHYESLARHWLAMPELRLPIAPNAAATWFTPHLAVSVRPDFAVADLSGKVTIVKLWLKESPLKRDAVRACLWLLDQYIAEISPCGTPVVVDVRREKVHRVGRRPFKRGFDAYLETEAEAMAALWQRLAALPDRLLALFGSFDDGESAS
jgi:hypothetical protein